MRSNSLFTNASSSPDLEGQRVSSAAGSGLLWHLAMSSELGQGRFHRAIALCSLVIALGASETKVGMAESLPVPSLFGGVG